MAPTLKEAMQMQNGPRAKFYMLKHAAPLGINTLELRKAGCDTIRHKIKLVLQAKRNAK